jgi:hypothetical protein
MAPTAALRIDLILQLHGARPVALEHAHRPPHAQHAAVPGVGVHHDRQCHHLADALHLAGHLRQGDKTEIRQSQVAVGDTGAGEVHRPKAQPGGDQGSQCVRHPRQDQGFRSGNQVAERGLAGVHRER